MEWVLVDATWIKARGRIKEQWSDLNEDHLDAVSGRRGHLVSKIGERYNIPREDADRQVTEWESRNRDLFEETAEQIKPYTGIAKQ